MAARGVASPVRPHPGGGPRVRWQGPAREISSGRPYTPSSVNGAVLENVFSQLSCRVLEAELALSVDGFGWPCGEGSRPRCAWPLLMLQRPE